MSSLVALGDWRHRRTEAGQRKLAIEDAGRQVAFAAEWWNARKLIADSPEAERQATTCALAWLEEASALIAESKPAHVDERSAITLRRLLLLDPLQSRTARLFRGAFYFCLALVPIWVGAVIHNTMDPKSLGLASYFLESYFYVDAISIAALMVLAMVFRFSAERAEKSTAIREKPGSMTLARALLLYHFKRRAAKIVRVFYLWTVVLILLAIRFVSLALADSDVIVGGTVQFIGFIGYGVLLRYWAASLEARADSAQA